MTARVFLLFGKCTNSPIGYEDFVAGVYSTYELAEQAKLKYLERDKNSEWTYEYWIQPTKVDPKFENK